MSKEGGTKAQWSVKQDIPSHPIPCSHEQRSDGLRTTTQYMPGQVYKRRETQWQLLVTLLPHLEENSAIVVLLEVDGDKDHFPGNTTHHVLLPRAGFPAPFGG